MDLQKLAVRVVDGFAAEAVVRVERARRTRFGRVERVPARPEVPGHVRRVVIPAVARHALVSARIGRPERPLHARAQMPAGLPLFRLSQSVARVTVVVIVTTAHGVDETHQRVPLVVRGRPGGLWCGGADYNLWWCGGGGGDCGL